jgi:excisionase family DNA binding protein
MATSKTSKTAGKTTAGKNKTKTTASKNSSTTASTRATTAPATASTPRSPLLTLDEAAAYLATTDRHVRRMWMHRELSAIKVGKFLRFAVADLDAYIDAQRIEAIR